ncbi:uncharacterized protein LOC135465950 [Liolophura sinensis]|uniref:uncharacterized protein LOC135465950 n=1 Tax=Liolophura sinensis TaxID=3198878 RepID=UPI0031589429
MGNIWGTMFQRKRLVRFQNCSGSQKKMAMAADLNEFRVIAREKLGFGGHDDIKVLESTTGLELEDDDVFVHLDPNIPLTVVNLTRGQEWTRPPDVPSLSQSHPLFVQPPHHQVAGRDASVTYTITNNVYNNQTQLVQVGDRQTVVSGVPTGATEDEDSQF